MELHEFTVVLNRCPDDDELDSLYEAGLDDTLPEIRHGHAVLHVARQAETLVDAILSVVADIEKAGFQATGIESEDLVTLTDIAAKTGRCRESVRLLATGKRGPGGFPAPLSTGKHPLYSWASVREWFCTNYGSDAVTPANKDADTLAAADLLLRARLLSPEAASLTGLVAA